MQSTWRFIHPTCEADPCELELVDRASHAAGLGADSILYHGADWPVTEKHKTLIEFSPDLLSVCKFIIDARDRAALSDDPAYYEIDQQINAARQLVERIEGTA